MVLMPCKNNLLIKILLDKLKYDGYNSNIS
nr:MAG TPA: hypothetical protein [Caudoviricetes sp.]